jgi:5-methylcytosine-specific restriction endonuclease McrA
MTKKIRDIVYAKFDGHCAYCGCVLEKGWQVDHIIPKVDGGKDDLNNLHPSCPKCNGFKKYTSLNYFKDRMINLLQTLKKHPDYKAALRFSMIEVKERGWDGKFYFEKITNKE